MKRSSLEGLQHQMTMTLLCPLSVSTADTLHMFANTEQTGYIIIMDKTYVDQKEREYTRKEKYAHM